MWCVGDSADTMGWGEEVCRYVGKGTQRTYVRVVAILNFQGE